MVNVYLPEGRSHETWYARNGVRALVKRRELAAAPLRVKVKLDRPANIIIVGLVSCRENPLPFRSHMALAKWGALWVCAF